MRGVCYYENGVAGLLGSGAALDRYRSFLRSQFLALWDCELARSSSRAPLFPETLGTHTPLPSSPGHGIGLPSPRLGIEALFR